MTDRTGGPTSPNYVHRTRPESYEEEDEDGSEGEDALILRARGGDPQSPYNGDEDDRLGNQDLILARSLRLRAEGLEKVVISMLEQPPPIHPVNNEDIMTPPTSPKLNASNHTTHPHRLPNGVRLRLALGTIINDLFARQAPPPPYRHTHIPNSKVTTPQDHSPPPIPSPSDLPHSLTTLAPVSGAFAVPHQPPSAAVPPRAMQKAHYTDYQQTYPFNQPSMQMPYPSAPQQPQQPSYHNRLYPSSRTRSLYAVGADPRTANSPPSLRCPRHLHTGCEICVEAKSPAPARQSGSSSRAGRATGFGSDRHGANSWKAMPGGVGPGGGGITGWQDGSGIGAGLLRPGVRGSALRRKVLESDPKTGSGNTKLSKLIPRFIRLSALVAAELGRESRGEEDESEDGGNGGRPRSGSSVASASGSTSAPGATAGGGSGQNEPGTWNTPGASGSSPFPVPSSPLMRRTSLQSQAQDRATMYEFALRPSLEWYMLLAGLLTRAVLEGYLAGGWKGTPAVQCLLLVGLGINENAGRKDEEEESDLDDPADDPEEFAAFDPDELPNLVEAVKILFPSLRDSSAGQKGRAEEEYEIEMLERLQKVRFSSLTSFLSL